MYLVILINSIVLYILRALNYNELLDLRKLITVYSAPFLQFQRAKNSDVD
jgi:hypothetical protein